MDGRQRSIVGGCGLAGRGRWVLWLGACVAIWLCGVATAVGEAAWVGDAGHFLRFQPRIFALNPDGRSFSVTVHRNVWPTQRGNEGAYRVQLLDPRGEPLAAGQIPSGQGAHTMQAERGRTGVYEVAVEPTGYGLWWVESDLPRMVVYAGPAAEIAETASATRPGIPPVNSGADRPEHAAAHSLSVRAEQPATPPEKHAYRRSSVLHAMVPRRWYFFVPEDTSRFSLSHSILPWQSHREDFCVDVYNPRGQRVASLTGGRPLPQAGAADADAAAEGAKRSDTALWQVRRTLEPDPGTTGRFWSIWVSSGDSHNYADLQLELRGVPPYLASSPEHWFNPNTGQPAPRLIYQDLAELRKTPPGPTTHPASDRDPRDASGSDGDTPGNAPATTAQQLPGEAHPFPRPTYFAAPTSFLGDEGYNGVVGPARIALWNPDNRRVALGIGSYIIPEQVRLPVSVELVGPDQKRLGEAVGHFAHGHDSRLWLPQAGAGVYRLRVNAGRCYAWTDPALPCVLVGQPVLPAPEHGNGKQHNDKNANGPAAGQAPRGHRFHLEIGTTRHWFFRVPKGVDEFAVAFQPAKPQHVLRAEIHAPDRRVALASVHGPQRQRLVVSVPDGLDGCLWFLRLGVGSATRFVSDDLSTPRQMRIETEIELQGVPGYLAPSWAQWFHPEDPPGR